MSIRILVIDDEEVIRKSFLRALEDTDYEVETAETGEKGILKARENKFDLIFLDLKMPGLNGVETLRELWKIGQTVPIYIVTAFYDDFREQLERAADDKISFYLLKKPVDLDEIRSLARVVAERQVRF
ncbi:MAG: response regulator [Dehalococcoidales bacterium]|nr:response regulator [Dehalococcoidales bacterium]MDZ4247572.1 response regulator [Dehalococcoidia bacterium]